MIYFVRHIKTGYIKIGCTSSVVHRLREIAYSHGAVALLGMMNGDFIIEKQLHAHFADYNIRPSTWWGKEWFSPAQPILDFIDVNAALIDNSFGMEFARWYAIGRGRKFTSNLPSLLLIKYGVKSADLLPHRKIIAKEIGIDPQVLNDWLRKNYIRKPIPNTVERICRFLRCGVADLLEYVPDERETA